MLDKCRVFLVQFKGCLQHQYIARTTDSYPGNSFSRLFLDSFLYLLSAVEKSAGHGHFLTSFRCPGQRLGGEVSSLLASCHHQLITPTAIHRSPALGCLISSKAANTWKWIISVGKVPGIVGARPDICGGLVEARGRYNSVVAVSRHPLVLSGPVHQLSACLTHFGWSSPKINYFIFVIFPRARNSARQTMTMSHEEPLSASITIGCSEIVFSHEEGRILRYVGGPAAAGCWSCL